MELLTTQLPLKANYLVSIYNYGIGWFVQAYSDQTQTYLRNIFMGRDVHENTLTAFSQRAGKVRLVYHKCGARLKS